MLSGLLMAIRMLFLSLPEGLDVLMGAGVTGMNGKRSEGDAGGIGE